MAEQLQAEQGEGFDLTCMAMAEWTGMFKGVAMMLDMSPKVDPAPDPYLDGLRELILLNKEIDTAGPTSRYFGENAAGPFAIQRSQTHWREQGCSIKMHHIDVDAFSTRKTGT